MSFLESFEENVGAIPGSVRKNLQNKFKELMDKNEGLQQSIKIRKVLNGDDDIVLPEEYKDPEILSAFKFAPITSVDVDRTFSVYNSCLATGAIF